MNFANFTELFFGLDDATWAKHSNPWSGWTRMLTLPLISIAVWSRVWLGWSALWLVLAVIIWTWANPRLFGLPKNDHAWMTKAVLGERVWLGAAITPIAAHHVRATRILNAVGVFGLALLTYGLWQSKLGWVCAGLITTVGAKLWFLDRMVWLLADVSHGTAQDECFEG